MKWWSLGLSFFPFFNESRTKQELDEFVRTNWGFSAGFFRRKEFGWKCDARGDLDQTAKQIELIQIVLVIEVFDGSLSHYSSKDGRQQSRGVSMSIHSQSLPTTTLVQSLSPSSSSRLWTNYPFFSSKFFSTSVSSSHLLKIKLLFSVYLFYVFSLQTPSPPSTQL